MLYLFISGLKTLLKIMNFTTGSRRECLRILKNGNLLGISPGGVREALFSDNNYRLLWGNRTGFAQLAIDAKVVSLCTMTFFPQYEYFTLCFITTVIWLEDTK